MGVAPIGAIKKALDRAGLTIEDIDVVELNEAFAAQVLPIAQECGIDMDKLNRTAARSPSVIRSG